MTSGYYHECDQCHKLERASQMSYGGTSPLMPVGWLSVLRHTSAQLEAELSVHGLEAVGVDVCSWACLVAYGTEHGWQQMDVERIIKGELR